MAFAAPVSRDNFFYNGDLYIEVANSNRHKRAPIADITTILRPDLKKSNKAPPVDQVGHWYEAQLIHYGLPPSKDKARAKMRLLETKKDNGSMSKGTSVVETTHPLTGEKMYKAPVQTAKSSKLSALRRAYPGMYPGPVKPGESRYSFTPSGPFNMRENDLVGPSGVSLESPAEQQVLPKKETIAKSRVKTEKKAPVKKEPNAKPVVKTESKAPVKKEIKKEVRIKMETKPMKESKAKKNSTNMPVLNSRSLTGPLGLINGQYDISCPTVESEWGVQDLSLTLNLNNASVWGAYDLGMFSGIIFLPNRPYEGSNRPLPFTWRGRELEGMMSFGPSYVGEMTFHGNGNIEGWISVYGRCEFSGTRIPEAGTAVRTWSSMRDEWDAYNQDEYDYENSARWR